MTDYLPLEKAFFKAASDKSKFPRMVSDYAVLYKGLLNHLRANIYKDIDAGLAANSDIPGFYTAHNSEHFDEVVRYAGLLLKIESGDEDIPLHPYELYMLLVAIRIHDAGNAMGRESHEKKCFYILNSCGDAAGIDSAEKRLIAKIAEAHGGETIRGDKDTIVDLDTVIHTSSFSIRARLLASIVRFADEICENSGRAANYSLKHGKLPKHSELFHKYCASITANVISFPEKRLTLKYTVNIKDVICPWGFKFKKETNQLEEKFLIDYILERLEKMDFERQYCNRFSKEIYTIDSIRATIEIVEMTDDGKDYKELETINVPELCDSGYPNKKNRDLRDELREYCGPVYQSGFPRKI